MKKLIKLVICCLLLGISNYSFGDNVTGDDPETVKLRPDSNDQIGNVLLQSISLIGVPYKWGGNIPDSGLDCSGFIRYVFKHSLGVTLPRTAAEMAKLGREIPLDQLEPGDLIFFNTNGGRRISHMGMYLGNNQFIQAPRTGKNIEITGFNQYYHSKFVVAKRMFQENIDGNGQTMLVDFRNERDNFVMKGVKRPKKHNRTRDRASVRRTKSTSKTKKHKKNNH